MFLASIQKLVMDTTGTMTEGVFKVQEVVFDKHLMRKKFYKWSMLWKAIVATP
jgi:Cd2+/Zn2+-exporting ATPase